MSPQTSKEIAHEIHSRLPDGFVFSVLVVALGNGPRAITIISSDCLVVNNEESAFLRAAADALDNGGMRRFL